MGNEAQSNGATLKTPEQVAADTKSVRAVRLSILFIVVVIFFVLATTAAQFLLG